MFKLGIDVGGTNTDAVLINSDLQVVKSLKVATSLDIYSGITEAIHEILKDTDIDRGSITQAMLAPHSVRMPLLSVKSSHRWHCFD